VLGREMQLTEIPRLQRHISEDKWLGYHVYLWNAHVGYLTRNGLVLIAEVVDKLRERWYRKYLRGKGCLVREDVAFGRKQPQLKDWEWRIRWKFVFGEKIDWDYIIKEYGMDVLERGNRWECICGFRTNSLETLGTHILKRHPWMWYELWDHLSAKFERCILVSDNEEKFTKDDFLYLLVERPKEDPESLFADDEFIEKFFGGAVE